MKLLYPLAKRFIAGHNFESAKPIIDGLLEDGFKISVDYLGELSKNKNDCDKAHRQYMDIINYYSARRSYIDLSIKPSQLGLKFDKEYCYNKMTIRLDMENISLTQDTIDLCYRLRKDYKNVGIAIQTNLFRTWSDIHTLMNDNISLRIVKGAYKETIKVAYQDKEQIRNLFVRNIFRIITDRCRSYYFLKDTDTPVSAIGTHDEEVLKKVIYNMNRFNVGKRDVDFEFLYGIRRDLSNELKDKNYTVRLYVPFGTEWFPYTMRRLKEFDNMKFVMTNVIKELWNGRKSDRFGAV